jgi:hypothetical protein
VTAGTKLAGRAAVSAGIAARHDRARAAVRCGAAARRCRQRPARGLFGDALSVLWQVAADGVFATLIVAVIWPWLTNVSVLVGGTFALEWSRARAGEGT